MSTDLSQRKVQCLIDCSGAIGIVGRSFRLQCYSGGKYQNITYLFVAGNISEYL